MMDYKILDFTMSPFSTDACDILSAMLGEVGFDSFESTDTGVKAYIPEAAFSEQDVCQVIADFIIPDISITYTVHDMENKDWNEEWERNSFDPVLERDFGIRLNPRGAFGSGSHETTYQIVEYLCKLDFSGQTVLDMGCGTGVLGIAMAMRGAESVAAIDIDEQCIRNTAENFLLNGLTNYTLTCGDASAICDMYDTIVANIHKNIIIRDLPVYIAHLRKGGSLIASGFFVSDSADVIEVAEGNGLQLQARLSKNDWAVLVFKL